MKALNSNALIDSYISRDEFFQLNFFNDVLVINKLKEYQDMKDEIKKLKT